MAMTQLSLERDDSCKLDGAGPRQHLIRHLSSDQVVNKRAFAIKAFPAGAGFDYGLLRYGERR